MTADGIKTACLGREGLTHIAFVRDHPWLRAGLGTLSNTGGIAPMHNDVLASWAEAISDSHDGYLQLGSP